MTTGDCCHLPGSLCDCSGSPAFSKVVEATGLGPPQYVAQVTSRDGRLLSTVIRALDTPSDCPFCRICHEGANGESLLSPCGCTGTLGAVHKSCLEKWLSSSNTSYCELCHTEFAVEKRPRPLTELLSTSHCCPICSLAVAEGPRASDREAYTVLRHGVLLVHHTTGCDLGLAVPTRSPGPPSPPQPAGGRGAHRPYHCPVHHLCSLDAGLFSIPLPVVFRVEKDQPESTAEDPGR
ncbi:E3 ubiquitin-protein ligase MARCHF2 isoform X2 [Castor canadensis]|uniref:E3 ubiquitin-protein ligase MARCHF2 isoform X2 n=1 Tax=Castor canadensis TaxID=51338 RepID=A0AC58KZM8_CASCN